MKDNLIDEKRAKEEEEAQECLDNKLIRMGKEWVNNCFSFFNIAFLEQTLDNLLTRFSRMIAEYSSFQTKIKQRIALLET